MALEPVRIEQRYREIARQMTGVPLINPALAVELLGWQCLEEGGQLGILITPWCMNLLWQPAGDLAFPGQGQPLPLSLASGDYECLAFIDEQLGPLACASLFSPMQDFASQPAARAVAHEVLALLLARPVPVAISRRGLLRRALGQPHA